MLPELLFTAADSMQDDFDFLNGANSIYKKGMCISPVVPFEPQLESPIDNISNNYIGIVAGGSLPKVARNDDPRVKDLFSNDPSTWKQHPMNGQRNSVHRLQNDEHRHEQRHQHRLNLVTNKLLLQNSDDPLICHGANSVCTGDDDSHLIISRVQNVENIETANPMFISSTTITQKLSSTTRSKQRVKKLPQNGCSLSTKQQLKVKAGLMNIQNREANEIDKSGHMCSDVAQTNNRPKDLKLCNNKGVLKLRFHHQALPPEYLIHYEATQGQLTPYANESKEKSSEARSFKEIHTSKQSPAKNEHENVRSWLKKITAIHRSAQEVDMEQNEKKLGKQPKILEFSKTEVYGDTNNNSGANRMQHSKRFSKVPVGKNELRFEPNHSNNCEKDQVHSLRVKCAMKTFSSNATTCSTISPSSLNRVINFSDLPYMGEITLDNSKPRRGRKPKKADICHLIYKNYGTILPGTPNNVLNRPNIVKEDDQKQGITDELPLNLCIRDLQCEHLSISSAESENACGMEEVECINTIHSGVANFLETELTNAMPTSDFEGPVILRVGSDMDTNNSKRFMSSFSNLKPTKLAESHSNNINSHPISLYYQKLLSGTLVTQSSQPFGLHVETIEKDNQLTLKIPIPNGLIHKSKTENRSPTLRLNSHTTDYPELMATPSSIKSENFSITATTSASITTAATNPIFTPQKRKRSAIFIPPIPADFTTNTPTEVSICKFKFTGGDKPSLEEKKMLSVDSGGNYRYYSSTGDKSTRGYEYFPRESLQNSAGFLPGVNCVAKSTNSENECSMNDVPSPSAELSNEILQIPESPTRNLLLPASVSLPEVLSPLPMSRLETSYSGSPTQLTQQQPPKIQIIVDSNYINNISTTSASSIQDNLENFVVEPLTCHSILPKKKSRRSTQREKLEKTFKEKGFLIQTQQLESAEGATYCKFRQLKKFTRYLFRNWKDYLPIPDEVHQSNLSKDKFLTRQSLTKNEMKKEENTSNNFTDQHIQNILERHGILNGSEVCSQNSALNNTSNLIKKILPEQKLVGNTAKTKLNK